MLRSIFQNRNLTLLWLGQMISQSGDSIYQIGLIWLTLELSGSESVTGMVAMSSYLPSVVLALFAGVVADRGNRKRIMLIADGWRAVVILFIPLMYWLGWLSPTMLGINAFAIAIAATFFNPARDSLIPLIVPQNGLLRANSLIQTSWQSSLLIGPLFAGLMLHYFGNINLFTFDSIAYVLSFVAILFIRPSQLPPQINRPSGLTDIKEGLNYAAKHPVILPLLLITVLDNLFIMGPAIVGTPVLVKQVLGLGADAYAAVMGCYAVGMLLGTALLLLYGKRFTNGQILLFGMILDGFTFIPLYYVQTLWQTGLVTIVHSIAIPFLTVTRAALIQKIVPSRMTGRIFALVNLAVVGVSAVSSGISGFALEAYGARNLFFVIGIGGGMCGVIGWFAARQLRMSD